ncbi:MAG: nucleotidyltransferase domain-containing protein [Promethearchaeota archaeon]
MSSPVSLTDLIQKYALSDKIRPSKDLINDIRLFHEYLPKIVRKEASPFPVKEIIPVGSTSRDTFLPGSTDLDYFVTLETDQRSLLEKFIRKITPKVAKATSALKKEYLYAENPYARLIIPFKSQIFEVDLVATVTAQNYTELREALKISGMARTPFHTKWLSPRVKGLETEIRLLKYWLKQKRIYGTFGLTGFLCELLLIKYRDFENLLQKFATGFFSNLVLNFDERTETELRKLFPDDKVIIADPCDIERNAAAGIQGFMGDKKLERLNQQAKYSLENPEELFTPLIIEPPYIIVKIKIEGYVNTAEIYTRLARYATKLRNTLKNEGYDSKDVFISSENFSIQFILDKYTQKETIVKGPPVRLIEQAENFKRKHKVIEEREERLYAIDPPKYPSAKDVIIEYLNKTKTVGTIEMREKKGEKIKPITLQEEDV